MLLVKNAAIGLRGVTNNHTFARLVRFELWFTEVFPEQQLIGLLLGSQFGSKVGMKEQVVLGFEVASTTAHEIEMFCRDLLDRPAIAVEGLSATALHPEVEQYLLAECFQQHVLVVSQQGDQLAFFLQSD